ncbi:MAG: hypothetical protein KJP27_01435 [Altererythrobacter sp.]|nr:hypothetical protein [Altererythrobacter sp.]
MTDVTACELPEGSLLARYGGPGDYRDCFSREVPGEVSLEQYIERFYSSMAFAPERLILGLIGHAKGWDASADAFRALARGEADRFGAWEVIDRRSCLVAEHGERPASHKGVVSSSSEAIGQQECPPASEAQIYESDQILLLSKDTNTASWLSVQPQGANTKLLFGSWVGGIDQSGWRVMLTPHVWYSRVLLGGC